jgi:hypothetical protein
MNTLPADLVDEIIQNSETLDIIRLSHVNFFYNEEIKKIFINNKKKTYKEYLGLNIIEPLELVYVNNRSLQLKKIKEYYVVYEKLFSEIKIDIYTLYRIYNNFMKLFKEIHLLTKNKQKIKNYYTLIKTLIVINDKAYYLFLEKEDYNKKQMIFVSLLRVILLMNPLNLHNSYQEKVKILFYNLVDKIILQISEGEIEEDIFFVKFLRDYLFELDDNFLTISYVEIFELKKFIKMRLKEYDIDILSKN